jgi:hypothetical protein
MMAKSNRAGVVESPIATEMRQIAATLLGVRARLAHEGCRLCAAVFAVLDGRRYRQALQPDAR